MAAATKNLARALLGKLGSAFGLQRLAAQVEDARILAGRLLARQLKDVEPEVGLEAVEFKVFSQFGEDGILQYLVRKCAIEPGLRTFVEFGVSDYEESNTRFLLMNDNWRGLVIDGSADNIAHIRGRPWYWRHELAATQAFITSENIDALIREGGYAGNIGILSIDIDGNDYWVWRAIQSVSPAIVVVEYNSVFGYERAVTIPYDAKFRRSAAHYSHLYWGCSIRSLEILAGEKGYALVGSNSAGNNAFFVRRDRLSGIRVLSAQEAYVESRFRESRDNSGALSFLSGKERLHAIRDMPVHDVERNEAVRIAGIFR